MEVQSRASRGVAATVEALDLVRRRQSLLLPITVSATVSVGFVLVLGAWIAGIAGLAAPVTLSSGLGALVVFLAYVLAAVTATAANLAVVVGVRDHFDSQPLSLGRELRELWRLKRAIFLWGLVSSCPGIVLGFLDRYGVGPISSRTVFHGQTWSGKTFFFLPVLQARESPAVGSALGESAATFRQLWPDSGAVSLGIDAAAALATGIGVVTIVLGFSAGNTLLGVVILLIGLGTLWAIFLARHAGVAVMKATLYRYTTGGQLPVGFEPMEPERLGYGFRRAGS